jgi:hypothetical protein
MAWPMLGATFNEFKKTQIDTGRVTSAAQSAGAALSEAREWRRFFVERAVACAM